MAESIIVKYEADISSLKAELNNLKLANLGVSKQAEDAMAKAKTAIAKVNSEAERNASVIGKIENQFAKLGTTIVAAFSVNAVIAFGKASIEAFAQAEKAQLKLLGALNGNTEVQKRLISQAKDLQSSLGIDDDTIISQQAFLALQNRTEEQITKTIQAAIQLSAVTGEDLQSAVQKLDATYEGNIGRLGKLDSRFNDLTKSQLANGEAIDLINEKYKGFAEAGAASVAGQLEIEKRRVEELSESVGERLAPAWVAVKKAALEYIETALAAFGIGEREDEKQLRRSKEAVAALTEKQFAQKNAAEIEAELIKQSVELNNLSSQKQTLDVKLEKELVQQRIDTLNELWQKRIKITKDGGQDEIETLEKLKAQREELEKQQLKLADPLGANKGEAQRLIKALEENQRKIDEITGKAQEERRKKAEEEAQKLADIERKGYEVARDEFEKIEKDKLDIQLKSFEVAREEFEKAEKEKQDIQKKSFEVAREEYEKLQEDNLKKQEEAEEQKRKNIQATFDLAVDLTNQIGEFLSAQDEAQIDAINQRRDTAIGAIDRQLSALEEANNKGKISDKQFEQQKKNLIAQRAAAEKKAADETKKLKQQEAEREKLLTVFKIGLILAEAIASVDVFKIIAATAQLAVAIATPIPQFAKGTKGKKESGVGLVGEQGAEFIYMPQGTQVVPADRTKRYKDAVNAMIDGQFEQYVYRSMIAPALKEATRKMEEKRTKSFAENIANVFNSSSEGFNEYRMRDALGANNKKQAEAIARALSKYVSKDSNDRYYH